MKKILLVLSMLAMFCSGAVASESGDVYLRRDVFEAKMDAFMSEIRLGNERLERRIDVLDEKIEGLKTSVYWALAGITIALASFGITIALPVLQKFFQAREVKQYEPLFTSAEIEVLKRLIASQLAEKI